VDVESRTARPEVLSPQAAVILLDTNAMIWLAQDHRRARPLRNLQRLHVSPASVLEIQFLAEAGRLRLSAGRTLESITHDSRWRLDEPPSAGWFLAACECSWTRDPFDRLLAAHARLRRWRLATADDELIERLPSSAVLEL
jgi:PIN domain nuclease of toxin-antitoxin system